jgi:H+/Cl- antiporter ClcA
VPALLSGIALVIEMTAGVTMLSPMLGASFVVPIVYDSLGEHALRRESAGPRSGFDQTQRTPG